MSIKKDKQKEAWSFWLSTLTEDAQKILEYKDTPILPIKIIPKIDDDCNDAYKSFCNLLSDNAKNVLEIEKELIIEDGIDVSVASFGIVECPDGEWGVVKLYKTFEGLARRVGQLEGSDTIIWSFFGIPIQLTKGPRRYLTILGSESAISVPLVAGDSCKVVPVASIKHIEIQDDGFLGPPELANSDIVQNKLTPIKKKTDKDDEDNEEEADEAGVD